MKLRTLAPFALTLALVGGCDKKDDSAAANKAAPVAGKAAPAGTVWSDNVVETPEHGYRMGNPDAPIKVIEYGSYTCSHCRDFNVESHEALSKTYVDSGKVSFEYRPYVRDPLDITVALIAECGGAEPFFPLTQQLFAYQEDMMKQVQAAGDDGYQAAMAAPPKERFIKLAQLGNLIEFAKQRGLSEEKVRTCLADPAVAERLAKSVETANSSFEISGTPTLIINNEKVDNVASWPALEPRLKAAGA